MSQLNPKLVMKILLYGWFCCFVEYVLGKSLGVCFLGSDFGSIFKDFDFMA